MMPLLMAKSGEANTIAAVHGKAETKRFLESMGFIEGAVVTVVNAFDGNLIVNIKDSRVALSKTMATKIFI